VQRYGGVPPYAETQQYVTKVLGYAAEYHKAAIA
jgi:soluble lytic murein transglycosylase-like protein